MLELHNNSLLYRIACWYYGGTDWTTRYRIGKDGCKLWKLAIFVVLLSYPITLLFRVIFSVLGTLLLICYPKKPLSALTAPRECYDYNPISVTIMGSKIPVSLLVLYLFILAANILVLRSSGSLPVSLLIVDLIVAMVTLFAVPLAIMSEKSEFEHMHRTEDIRSGLSTLTDYLGYIALIVCRAIGTCLSPLLLGCAKNPRNILSAPLKQYYYHLRTIEAFDTDIPVVWLILGGCVTALYVAVFILGYGPAQLRAVLQFLGGALLFTLVTIAIGVFVEKSKENRRSRKNSNTNEVSTKANLKEIYRSIKERYCPQVVYLDPPRN